MRVAIPEKDRKGGNINERNNIEHSKLCRKHCEYLISDYALYQEVVRRNE